jgi:SAM-dependent methyltransferase
MGPRRLAKIGFDRFRLAVLARYYGFHPWHAASPSSRRPYRYVVAELVNSVAPQVVVEVGCGLGEILSRVRAAERYGYDIDAGVIRAARFLHGPGITFVHGDASQVAQKNIDVLILVNWIHELGPSELEGLLQPLLGRTRLLVLDAIDVDSSAGYAHKHNFEFLRDKAHQVAVMRAPDEGRGFQLFAVNHDGEVHP